METRTGKIHDLNSIERFNLKEELAQAEKHFKEKMTELTNREYDEIRDLPEDKRPEELALIRFIEERKRLGAPHGLPVQNAFRLGYLACKKDQA